MGAELKNPNFWVVPVPIFNPVVVSVIILPEFMVILVVTVGVVSATFVHVPVGVYEPPNSKIVSTALLTVLIRLVLVNPANVSRPVCPDILRVCLYQDRLAAEPVVFWFNVGKVQLVSVPDAGVPRAIEAPNDVNELAVTPDASVLAVSVSAAAVTVILAEPLKDTPLIFRAVCKTVADPALPETVDWSPELVPLVFPITVLWASVT